jgi:hypothetical protein
MEFVNDIEFTAKPREYKKGPRGPRARSAEQKQYDQAFENAHNTSGVLAVQVKPEDAEEARKKVNSAARLLNLATTEGEARPGKVKGLVILSWKTRVPDKRKPKTSTPVATQAPVKK